LVPIKFACQRRDKCILEKPTVVIIKSSPWKIAYLYRNHPEYSAIFDIIRLYESKIQFILIGTSKTPTSEVLLKNGVKAWDIKSTGGISSFVFHLDLLKFLFKYKPNLVIVLGLLNILPVSFYSLLSRKSKYVPIFIGEIGYYGMRKINKCLMTLSLRLFGIFLRLSGARIFSAFSLSTYTRGCVEKLAPNLCGKIKLISYPISPIFNFNHHNGCSKRLKEPVILTVAGIEPRKGLDTLIKAVSFIPIKVKVIIKGSVRDSNYMDKLRVMAKDLKVEDRITFVTNVMDYDSLSAYYKTATLFVLPTREDCLGVAILEALHSGLPVIATSTGGIPDMIENNVNGILVRPDDPRELANAILMILNSDALRKKIIESIKNTLNNRYYKGRITLKDAMIQTINCFI